MTESAVVSMIMPCFHRGAHYSVAARPAMIRSVQLALNRQKKFAVSCMRSRPAAGVVHLLILIVIICSVQLLS